MLTGNKGEWSEVYVFLKLLGEGRLNAADANLNAIPNVYYPIIKILRQEGSVKREYVIDGDIKIIDGNTRTLILSVPRQNFVTQSEELFTKLSQAKARSHSFPEIEEFLNKIGVKSLAAQKTDKADIRVVVHDLKTGIEPTLGFSIKSMLGKNSTLFNAGTGTNFIYKITPPKGLALDIEQLNIDTYREAEHSRQSKIALRIDELLKLKCSIEFDSIQSRTLYLNLTLIDSQLPKILASMIFTKFHTGESNLKCLVQELVNNNPLNFDLSLGHPFYEYKIKNFLTDNALGMTPETIWSGKYDATGGIIIVKENGDLVCYHIYNRNEFQDYLLANTKIEQASTSEDEHNPGYAKLQGGKPYKYGWIYEENGGLYIKLNLQIRFT